MSALEVARVCDSMLRSVELWKSQEDRHAAAAWFYPCQCQCAEHYQGSQFCNARVLPWNRSMRTVTAHTCVTWPVPSTSRASTWVGGWSSSASTPTRTTAKPPARSGLQVCPWFEYWTADLSDSWEPCACAAALFNFLSSLFVVCFSISTPFSSSASFAARLSVNIDTLIRQSRLFVHAPALTLVRFMRPQWRTDSSIL